MPSHKTPRDDEYDKTNSLSDADLALVLKEAGLDAMHEAMHICQSIDALKHDERVPLDLWETVMKLKVVGLRAMLLSDRVLAAASRRKKKAASCRRRLPG